MSGSAMKANADNDSTRSTEKDPGTVWLGGTNVRLADSLEAFLQRAEVDCNSEATKYLTVSASKHAERIVEIASNIPSICKKLPVTGRNYALQEWEGCVLEVKDDMFIADLKDITNADNVHEQADFLIEDLRKDDLILLRPGAIFRWIIGYDIAKDGGKRRFSQIVFRRLPQWTKNEIDQADSAAHELMDSITWE